MAFLLLLLLNKEKGERGKMSVNSWFETRKQKKQQLSWFTKATISSY